MAYKRKYPLEVFYKKISEQDWAKYQLELTVRVKKVEEKKEEDIPAICYWEIMYQYINWETSLAYPQHVFPKDKVEGRVYYGTKSACQRICNAINEIKRTSPVRYRIINGFHD